MTGACSKCGTTRDSASLGGLCPRCVALDFLSPTDFDPGSDLAITIDLNDTSECRLADYELIEEIGRGGMGIVYRARQLSLGREVALKFLLQGALAGDDAVARFRGEAEAAAGLRHPNIVHVHEVGLDRGRLYFSMELVRGRSLAEAVRQGPLPSRAAATFLHRIAGAVHYAHGQGVLHRDLKPSNVLVDERNEPHVTDFGLAKRLGQGSDLTLSGQVLGTPAYISPEQADAGRFRPVDVRSDVYSLGAILYHLVTGRPPFTGESPTAVLRQVADSDPIPPRFLNPTVSRDLETVCLKCLQKEPARRYANAQELAEDLGRYLNDEPIRARPIGPGEKALRWCRRRPALAAALTSVALLLVGITLVSQRSARRIETLRLDGLTNLYVSDMRLAQQAIAESKFGAATEWLERHRPRPGDPDLRGFEWRHFWHQCHGDEAATLGSHSNQAQRALFSPDGRLVATASTDVRVWDVATRRLRHVFPCGDFVRALAFSPDGQRLATAEQAGGLRGFDLATGREIASRIKTGPSPFALQWPSAESRVELWAQGRRATWDWAAGDLTHRLGLPAESSRDAVSDHGVFISLQRGPWRLAVWESNALVAEFPAEGPALAAAVSADGRQFALGEFSGTLSLFALSPTARTNRVSAHRGLINVIAFSPQGERVASGGADQVIRLWDTTSGRPLHALRGHRQPIWSLAFSPDGDWLVSGDAAGVVKLWSTRSNLHDPMMAGMGTTLLATDGAAWAYAATNGGRWFRAGSPDAAGQALSGERTQARQLAGVTARRLLWVDANGVPRLEEADGSVAGVQLPPEILPGTGLLSPNGQFLLYQLVRGRSQSVWDLAAGRLAWEHDPGTTREHLLAISGDSRLVVAGDTAGRLQVFQLSSGRKLRTLHAHASAAYAADFSPDGRQMVSASHDGTVKLWDSDTGQLLGVYRSNADAYWTVAIASDGRRIAAGTLESSVVLWDVASRQEVATFQLGGPFGPVEGTLRFAPDGTALLLNTRGILHQWAAPWSGKP